MSEDFLCEAESDSTLGILMLEFAALILVIMDVYAVMH